MFPLAGKIPQYLYLKESGYRVLTIESYLVFYKIVHRTVQVYRVVHSARSVNLLIGTFDQ